MRLYVRNACFLLLVAGMGLVGGTAHANESTTWEWTREELRNQTRIERAMQTVKGFRPGPGVPGLFMQEDFYVYESREYAVFTNTNMEFAIALTMYMDRFVKTFQEVFPIRPRGPVRNRLIVAIFRNREQYQIATGQIEDEWSRGLFKADTQTAGLPIFGVYSYLDDPKEASLRTFPLYILQHEGAHAMIRTYAGTTLQVYVGGIWINFLPTFVDEAVATFFENWDLSKTEEENMAAYDTLFTRRRLIPPHLKDPAFRFDLNHFLLIQTNKPGSTPWAPDDGGLQTSLHYALAQSFAHYSLSTPARRRVFQNMFAQIFDSRDPFSERDLKRVGEEWNAYLREILLSKPE